MRSELISNLNSLDRIVVGNDFFLKSKLEPDDFNRLERSIKNGDLLGINIQDKSNLFGTVKIVFDETFIVFDLLPDDAFKLDKEKDNYVVFLEPGDERFIKTSSMATPTTQGDKGLIVYMRPFDASVDGVGTRVAMNPRELQKSGVKNRLLLGRVVTLGLPFMTVDFDNIGEYIASYNTLIVFANDTDIKKVRPFDKDRDGVGSRVAVLGSSMPFAENDVTKMYYGTIKEMKDRTTEFFYLGIEFDTKIVGGTNLGGLIDNDSGQYVLSYDVLVIDGSATKNVDNSFFLKSIADVLLSTTSQTNLNRIEVVESALAENFGADGKEAIEYALESKESFNLFQEILEGLGQMEARRLGVSVKPKIETLTPAPAAPKAPRKKKEPVSAEPIEIITPDTSVFQNEDELSSILDEFLT